MRSERAEKGIEFIDRSGAYEFTQKMLEREESPIDFEQFKDFLVRINGIIRKIPIKERNFDGRDVGLSGPFDDALVPKHEDKEELLKYAFESLERVESGEEKYLLSAVVNAVHLFEDGNGRTSRAFYQLLEKYASKEEFIENLKSALGAKGRFNAPDINPGLIRFDIEKIILEKYGWKVEQDKSGYIESKFQDEEPIRFASVEAEKIKKDHPAFRSVKNFFLIFKVDADYLKAAFLSEINKEKIDKLYTDKYSIRRISPLKMIEILDENDWQRIFDKYYELKREHVKVLIDCFVHPGEFKSFDEPEMNLKDYFVKKIQENYELNKDV